MSRRFYSSRKQKAREQTPSGFWKIPQRIEKLPFRQKLITFLGVFVFCFLLGAALAAVVNTSTLSFLLKFSRLSAFE